MASSISRCTLAMRRRSFLKGCGAVALAAMVPALPREALASGGPFTTYQGGLAGGKLDSLIMTCHLPRPAGALQVGDLCTYSCWMKTDRQWRHVIEPLRVTRVGQNQFVVIAEPGVAYANIELVARVRRNTKWSQGPRSRRLHQRPPSRLLTHETMKSQSRRCSTLRF